MVSKSYLNVSHQIDGFTHWAGWKWIILFFFKEKYSWLSSGCSTWSLWEFCKTEMALLHGCWDGFTCTLKLSSLEKQWYVWLKGLQRIYDFSFCQSWLLFRSECRMQCVVHIHPSIHFLLVHIQDHYFIPLWNKVKERFENRPSIKDAQSFS